MPGNRRGDLLIYHTASLLHHLNGRTSFEKLKKQREGTIVEK